MRSVVRVHLSPLGGRNRRRTLKTEYRNKDIQKEKKKKKKAPYSATLGGIREGSSQKGRRADALALGADERRDKLRKAAGSGRYAKIRRCLNGETHAGRACVSVPESIGCGGEPGELKHLSSRRKRKQK